MRCLELPHGYTAFNIYITPYVTDARHSSLPNVSAYYTQLCANLSFHSDSQQVGKACQHNHQGSTSPYSSGPVSRGLGLRSRTRARPCRAGTARAHSRAPGCGRRDPGSTSATGAGLTATTRRRGTCACCGHRPSAAAAGTGSIVQTDICPIANHIHPCRGGTVIYGGGP